MMDMTTSSESSSLKPPSDGPSSTLNPSESSPSDGSSSSKKQKRHRLDRLSDAELAAHFLTREDLKLPIEEMREKMMAACHESNRHLWANVHPRDGMDPRDPEEPLPEGYKWMSAFPNGTGKHYVVKVLCLFCAGEDHLADECPKDDGSPEAIQMRKDLGLYFD